jgi:hypothetical protein
MAFAHGMRMWHGGPWHLQGEEVDDDADAGAGEEE